MKYGIDISLVVEDARKQYGTAVYIIVVEEYLEV